MAVILVADDDEHIREWVRITLERDGFTVLEAADGRTAFTMWEEHQPDLIILDILMPGWDGWRVCEELRRYTDIPILMLTALGETPQKVRGLNLGADDYLVKPFEAEELLARVHALLRRYKILVDHVLDVAGVRLNSETYEVERKGRRMAIPPKEFQLLFTLACSPGRTLSRDQLIEQIWGIDYAGDERTVDVHIKRLRERFPEEEYPFRIRTVRGLGYRLEVEA